MFFLPGNHLYPLNHLEPHRQARIVMVEDSGICRRIAYHQQKLALVIAGMRTHARALRDAGFNVDYRRFDARDSIESALAGLGPDEPLHTFVVTDHRLRRLLRRICDAGRCSLDRALRSGFSRIFRRL